MGRRGRAAVAEMEAFDAAATRGVSKATSNISKTSDLFAAARAVLENDTETLRRLLASRAVSPDAADERGDTLLSLSCGLGRRGATKALLRAGADLNAKNAAGVAPVDGRRGGTLRTRGFPRQVGRTTRRAHGRRVSERAAEERRAKETNRIG